MKNNRREFIRMAGMAGLGLAGKGMFDDLPALAGGNFEENGAPPGFMSPITSGSAAAGESIIGSYGSWAAGLMENRIPLYSFRRNEWKNLSKWRKAAVGRLAERLAMPATGPLPEVTVVRKYTFDGLHIEELEYRLPYGPASSALLLKPEGASGRLPGVLAFHDHGGNKFHGIKKIVRTDSETDLMIAEHQLNLYEGEAWANNLAKRGYVVLVPDAFPFGSRRVLLSDIPEGQRQGLSDPSDKDAEGISAYNRWAGQHEHIMAKSLFSAGTTWPGVWLAEDIKALDILCSRDDVDRERIGCGGLSGGGMRSLFLGGFDARIKCCIPVGFMTTWRDLVLYKATTHTWMVYVPVLPNELDLPEILGLRAPDPVLVLNNSEDPLFTPDEMKRADGILRDVYAKAGGSDRYRCSFHPGPHKFDRAMQDEAFAWFDRWLKQLTF